MECLGFVRVTSGVTYDYLKDIDLFGRTTEEGDFILFGCKVEDEHALSLDAGRDYHNPADTERIDALVADKDEQAGRIMRMEKALNNMYFAYKNKDPDCSTAYLNLRPWNNIKPC